LLYRGQLALGSQALALNLLSPSTDRLGVRSAAERSVPTLRLAVVTLGQLPARLLGPTPTTEAGLLAISGIGPVKLESYGDELIAIAEQLRTS
jgi:hypothetical protein